MKRQVWKEFLDQRNIITVIMFIKYLKFCKDIKYYFLTKALGGGCYSYPYFTDGVTEIDRLNYIPNVTQLLSV